MAFGAHTAEWGPHEHLAHGPREPRDASFWHILGILASLARNEHSGPVQRRGGSPKRRTRGTRSAGRGLLTLHPAPSLQHRWQGVAHRTWCGVSHSWRNPDFTPNPVAEVHLILRFVAQIRLYDSDEDIC